MIGNSSCIFRRTSWEDCYYYHRWHLWHLQIPVTQANAVPIRVQSPFCHLGKFQMPDKVTYVQNLTICWVIRAAAFNSEIMVVQSRVTSSVKFRGMPTSEDAGFRLQPTTIMAAPVQFRISSIHVFLFSNTSARTWYFQKFDQVVHAAWLWSPQIRSNEVLNHFNLHKAVKATFSSEFRKSKPRKYHMPTSEKLHI